MKDMKDEVQKVRWEIRRVTVYSTHDGSPLPDIWQGEIREVEGRPLLTIHDEAIARQIVEDHNTIVDLHDILTDHGVRSLSDLRKLVEEAESEIEEYPRPKVYGERPPSG